jgi:hypothetical protein
MITKGKDKGDNNDNGEDDNNNEK